MADDEKDKNTAPADPSDVIPEGETDETADTSTSEDASGRSDTGEDLNGPATARAAEDDYLREMMATNFIEYASYVIKDRAIPDVDDGLKPVQRRILWALHTQDDGRFHKVANIIGQSMQYHPHGDASIGSALVVLANKEYFIEKQGNFGNIFTGDEASAARYIECRLTPLAREVLFNREITEFVDSYDGRKQEPVRLPAKVPSLLMLGAEGIAVGMTTRVLSHNFNELIDAQIAILKGRSFKVYPDFLTGGIMDVSEYDDGRGKVRLRARIETPNPKTLVIREIPATTTTEGLMTSLEDAARRNKIKIASINDYTAEKVEIEIQLPRGTYAEDTIKRLYAYTHCEVDVSANMIVISENQPVEMTVSEVLRRNTDKLVQYLKWELEIELGKLQDRFHEKTLAQIFIENRIYKRIEECETYEAVLSEVRTGLEPFRHMLRRDVTDEDIEKLLQIQIRRISLFDLNKNRQELDDILVAIEETKHHLEHLTAFATAYLRALKKKYGFLFPRHTEIADLTEVNVREVALENLKVGHDRVNHFAGYEVRNSNKSDDYLRCSEYDRLLLIENDGTFKVIPVPDKLYVGPVKFMFKADKEQVYCMIYRDRKKKAYFAKRFHVSSYIMDKEYRAAPKGSFVEAIYTNYGVVLRCEYAKTKRTGESYVDVDFEEVAMRSAGARGFKIADREITSLIQLRRGSATPHGEEEEEGQAPDVDSAGEAIEDEEGTEAAELVLAPLASPQSQGIDWSLITSRKEKAKGRKGGGKGRKSHGSDEESGDAPESTTPEEESPPPEADDITPEEKPPEPETPDVAPESPATAPEGRRVADEWRERSAEAAAVPEEGPVRDQERDALPAPEPAQPKRKSGSGKGREKTAPAEEAIESEADAGDADDDDEGTQPPAPRITPPRAERHIRIDEDTPFFLE